MNIPVSEWPDGAEYVTQDSIGTVKFWSIEPSTRVRTWIGDGFLSEPFRGEDNPNWKQAIMKRPAITGSKARATVTSLSVLQEVSRIQEERGAIYEGQEQERSMAKIVSIFNLHHGTQITEAQGWHFMEILKNVRLFNAPEYHHDSGVDGVSYAALKVEAKAKEKR